MRAAIRDIQYYLPEETLSTEKLSEMFPDWGVAKIDRRIGISNRHIAADYECSSDLAYAAAIKLFETQCVTSSQIDCLLFCTQTPDHRLPATACVLQDRLGLPTSCFAIDIYQGCSGFVYALGIATGMIETGQAKKVLLLTADTITKFVHPQDRSVRTVFGDAGAATLVALEEHQSALIGPFLWGTDGSGEKNLIVPAGGTRLPRSPETAIDQEDENGVKRSPNNIYMNGPEIFEFTLSAVPTAFHALLRKAGKRMEEVDLFVFHQANRNMLTSLRKSLGVPEEKFYFAMEDCGNTASSSIPIALNHAHKEGKLKRGDLTMLLGFGVGYSWGGALVRWGHPNV